jgi:aminoglycoside phosphotransferase (APT) family kinase protein
VSLQMSYVPRVYSQLGWRVISKISQIRRKVRPLGVSQESLIVNRTVEGIAKEIGPVDSTIYARKIEIVDDGEDGGDNLVAEVGGEWIYKFPNSIRSAERLCFEAGILARLRKYLAIRVPKMVLYRNPTIYSRHQKIGGNKLQSEHYSALSEKEKDALADALAQFFRELHGIPFLKAVSWGARPVEDQILTEEICSRAEKQLPVQFRNFPAETLRRWSAAAINPARRVLGHFDCHGGNIAFDQEHGRINGIFDFANAGLGDLHLDLCRLNWVSQDLTTRVIDRYERSSGSCVDRQRVDLHTAIHLVFDLAHQIGNIDEALVMMPRLAGRGWRLQGT